MKTGNRHNIGKRIAAVLLAVMLAAGTLPTSMYSVGAATPKHPDAVTISVVNEAGEALEGASVTYAVCDQESKAVQKEGIERTDEHGVARVMDSSAYTEGMFTLRARVSKEGYRTDDTTVADTPIASAQQDFRVQLKSSQIQGVTVRGVTETYQKGKSFDAVVVSGANTETDSIWYKLGDGEWKKNLPKIEDAGTYTVAVKVQREGYEDYEVSVESKIEKASFTTEWEAYEGDYDGKEHPALKNVSGYEAGDAVTCTMNGTEYNGIPKIIDAGTYEITVRVHRNDNYEDAKKTYTAKIRAIAIKGLSAELADGWSYDGESRPLVKSINGWKEGDQATYEVSRKTEDGEWEIVQSQSKEAPSVTDAGEYKVKIWVSRKNHTNTEVVQLTPEVVEVKKATQTIAFSEKNREDRVVYRAGSLNEYDFAATGGSYPNAAITYRVENDSREDNTSMDAVAEIDEHGKLTLKAGGYNLKVTATVAGNENYEEASVTYAMAVVRDYDLLSFEQKELSYTLGNGSTVADQEAVKKAEDDRGEVTYQAEVSDKGRTLEAAGLSLAGHRLTVQDDIKLDAALQANGGCLEVVVTAEKAEGMKAKISSGQDVVVYEAATDSYTVQISYQQTTGGEQADALYELLGPKSEEHPDGEVLNGPNGEHGWYNTAVRIKPKDGYQIGKTAKDFASEITFEDQGTHERVIYLKKKGEGILEPIYLNLKIDTMRPDANGITIDYSTPVFQDLLSNVLWFYDAPVTVTFTARDAKVSGADDDTVSGIDRFTWNYQRSSDASATDLAADSGTAQAVEDEKEKGLYRAQVVLPKSEAQQLRGSIRVSVTDRAGLTSEEKKDDGRVLVVDTISPTHHVTYGLANAGGTSQSVGTEHYFSDDVRFTFQIQEKNFYAEDVVCKVTRNGTDIGKPELCWEKKGTLDLYEAACTLHEEGDYVVTLEYKDRSNHSMESYQSEVVTIDRTAPEITFSYADHTAKEHPQTATVTIKERNFRPEDLEVDTMAKNIRGYAIIENGIQNYLQTTQWKREEKNGEIFHTATLSDIFADAVYQLTINYKDLALNEAARVETGEFTVDHTAPEASSMEITYSTPLLEKMFAALTFGYYNPTVEVTFKAEDMTSGVDFFTWSYQREADASKENAAKYVNQKTKAVQDQGDATVFTGTLTLPLHDAEQLRGHLAFTATDVCGNTSVKKNEAGHILVVDTIAPQMTAEYNKSSRTVGKRMYYNKAASVTFTVTEANFYAEDILVELSKDGGDFVKIQPAWSDVSADVHVGTYTIPAPKNHSRDGDYKYRVHYTDRSNNQMTSYVSGEIVIDTIVPNVQVSYDNHDVQNVLKDAQGHKRKYFDDTQTATITVTEHNFNEKEVKFHILAKDVSGKAVSKKSAVKKSAWKTDGDRHTMTITYPGDANYTFGMDYVDLATNESKKYREDYFTVDQSAPVNLNVSYSTSVLETFLQNVSFGFYNARMTVTLQAEDTISGVHEFLYDCKRAPGASGINGELLRQAIQEADITYSQDRSKATARFDLPAGAMGGNGQFHGTVSFTAADRSENETASHEESKRIVVDTISPTASVTYNEPEQEAGGVSYYSGSIRAAVSIQEANFYPEDVQVHVTKDGASYSVSPNWMDNGSDSHVGTFSLEDDGDYLVTVSYTDKSGNQMAAYTSGQMTVDTKIEKPVIKVNGREANGKAFREEVVPEISFEDVNFENYEVQMTRTRYGKKDEDVTETFIGNRIKKHTQGGTGTFRTFAREPEVDGIYTLKVKMTDKAGHTSQTASTFTVNRFGSVYEYGDYLMDLILDGGAYVQHVEQPLVITEYNADRLLSGSLSLTISRDGKPLEEVIYEVKTQRNTEVTDQVDERVSVGESGWFQYEYTIAKENFETDGVYKIAVASKDATGNSPETLNFEDKNILFRVDRTAPEIESITGFEYSIINAQTVEAKYTIYDTIGLSSIKVYVDGENIETVSDFSGDTNNYTGRFILSEKNDVQNVRLVAEDLAGNITDTDAKDFQSAFAFHKAVTISTNAWVRFYANQTLFWGTLGGGLAVALLLILLAAKKMKKK